MLDRNHFLLPLCLDDVPAGLVRALAQEGVPWCRLGEKYGEFDPRDCRFVLFDARRNPTPSVRSCQVAIDIDTIRDAMWTDTQTLDPFDAMMDNRASPHRWQIGGLSVGEEIARVDRRAVRRGIMRCLRKAIEAGGGIWLNIGPYPFPYRSALNVRIDYDQYDEADFRATLDGVAGYEQTTTHFVNAAAYVNHDDAIARLAELDVGSHGYHHHTYRTEEENLTNISRGIEVLRVLGIEPSGFAAPRGRFNASLLAAMRTLGITHSSEFGLAYDDWPFFHEDVEADKEDVDGLLQIPIHPVSLGIFLEAVQGEGARREAALQQAVRAAVTHFRETARAKYHTGEPLFFYGHPTGRLGRFPQVLRAILETADEFGAIWKTTLTEFAAWWRVRRAVRLRVIGRENEFQILADYLPKGHRLALEYWRGRHVARLPLDGESGHFSPSRLAYENRRAQPTVHPVRIDQAEGLRGRVRRWLDWEHETPVNEIRANTWRNWAKRTLRRLRDKR